VTGLVDDYISRLGRFNGRLGTCIDTSASASSRNSKKRRFTDCFLVRFDREIFTYTPKSLVKLPAMERVSSRTTFVIALAGRTLPLCRIFSDKDFPLAKHQVPLLPSMCIAPQDILRARSGIGRSNKMDAPTQWLGTRLLGFIGQSH
jgi:hypothetical protein